MALQEQLLFEPDEEVNAQTESQNGRKKQRNSSFCSRLKGKENVTKDGQQDQHLYANIGSVG